MNQWMMLTLVGKDQKGIVAKITSALYQAGAQLGEASMMRLGGNFTIMLMVGGVANDALETAVVPVAKELGLTLHMDAIEAGLHQHTIPNIRVTVHGADRPGIVAKTTEALFEQGVNITDLESDVAGSEKSPIYILHIEGTFEGAVETLDDSLKTLRDDGITVDVDTIDTLIG